MKNLLNLGKALNKAEQKEVFGGEGLGKHCSDSCVGKAIGDTCWHQNSCLCPGQCTSQGCQPI